MLVFLTWSGRGSHLPIKPPDASTLATVVLVVTVVGGVLWLTPLGRRLAGTKLFLSVREIVAEIKALAADPRRLVLLLGGATLGKLLVIVAFVESTRAFGIGLGFGQLGALYLTANTVASAAPTPGGVGAIEAALVATLTAAGVEAPVALSAVIMFRLVTYWLPVPFSWLALRHLRDIDAV